MDKKIDLSNSQLLRIANFLKKSIGIDLDLEKLKRFKRRIENVFSEHGIDDFSNFYHQLRFKNNQQLQQDLINAVTVNETYFWREYEQFLYLTKKVLPQYIQKKIQHIRILVAPTSSGEELYSIMLAILDEKDLIENLDIEIVGIDIDSEMIAKAKKGVYTKRSTDKLPHHLLEQYFKKTFHRYEIDKNLTNSVYFTVANIFDKSIIQKLGEFDIVFSRNMLIYFDTEEKIEALKQFYKLLKPGGYLFLGHADGMMVDKKDFRVVKEIAHLYQSLKQT